MIRRGGSCDISFCTDTVMPRRSTPRSSALIPMVVLMHVARAVATKSVGEKASPLPLLSLGASVEIFDCEGPCVASQCKSPAYLTETSTMRKLCDCSRLLSHQIGSLLRPTRTACLFRADPRAIPPSVNLRELRSEKTDQRRIIY